MPPWTFEQIDHELMPLLADDQPFPLMREIEAYNSELLTQMRRQGGLTRRAEALGFSVLREGRRWKPEYAPQPSRPYGAGDLLEAALAQLMRGRELFPTFEELENIDADLAAEVRRKGRAYWARRFPGAADFRQARDAADWQSRKEWHWFRLDHPSAYLVCERIHAFEMLDLFSEAAEAVAVGRSRGFEIDFGDRQYWASGPLVSWASLSSPQQRRAKDFMVARNRDRTPREVLRQLSDEQLEAAALDQCRACEWLVVDMGEDDFWGDPKWMDERIRRIRPEILIPVRKRRRNA